MLMYIIIIRWLILIFRYLLFQESSVPDPRHLYPVWLCKAPAVSGPLDFPHASVQRQRIALVAHSFGCD
jgi:hypothetical protein